MITPTWYPDDRQLKQFALVCLPGFALMGLMVVVYGGPTILGYLLACLGVVLLGLGLAAPRSVAPVYLVLMLAAVPIGWVVSNLLVRIIFYVVLTPIGFVFRLLGRDALALEKPQVNTYWKRHTQRDDPSSYFRQA